MPLVSIGLPVYNGDNFVGQAIASVLAQSFDDWELIISDNGSSDRTEQICRQFAGQDVRIQYHRSPENLGAAANFNRVFELSRGKYFRWLSHDDVLLPDAIAVCVAGLENDPELVLCANATGAIDADGFRLLDAGTVQDFTFQGLTATQEAQRIALAQADSAAQRFRGILLFSRRCYEVYGLIRREQMGKTQLHPSYCGGEKVLLAELALQGKFREHPEKLFFCRWHDARFTSNNSAHEQAEHMAPGRHRWFSFPHQYRATLGYLQLAIGFPMSLQQRVLCLFTWTVFVFQVRKWAAIISNTVKGRATAATVDMPVERGAQIVFSEFSGVAECEESGTASGDSQRDISEPSSSAVTQTGHAAAGSRPGTSNRFSSKSS